MQDSLLAKVSDPIKIEENHDLEQLLNKSEESEHEEKKVDILIEKDDQSIKESEKKVEKIISIQVSDDEKEDLPDKYFAPQI